MCEESKSSSRLINLVLNKESLAVIEGQKGVINYGSGAITLKTSKFDEQEDQEKQQQQRDETPQQMEVSECDPLEDTDSDAMSTSHLVGSTLKMFEAAADLSLEDRLLESEDEAVNDTIVEARPPKTSDAGTAD